MDTQLIASFRLVQEEMPKTAKQVAKRRLFFVVFVLLAAISIFSMFVFQEIISCFVWLVSYIIILYWGEEKPHYYGAASLDFFQDKMEVKKFIAYDKSENLPPSVHHVFLYEEMQDIILRYIQPSERSIGKEHTIFKFSISVAGKISRYEIVLEEGAEAEEIAVAEMQKVLLHLREIPDLKVLELNSKGENLHLLTSTTQGEIPQKHLDLIDEIGEREE
ncbi:MAG: hypothetical protein ACKVTZ_23505 [Bacteroidia bacterium]